MHKEKIRKALADGRVVNAVIPPRCPGCGHTGVSPGSLCGSCWGTLRFIGAPLCTACGVPFAYDHGTDTLCARCIASKRYFRAARAALRYDEASRPLVTRFKYGDALYLAPLFARFMQQAGRELCDAAQIMTPVPLHPYRLLARRYNQAALLARHLGRLSGIPLLSRGLKRVRYTPPQASLPRDARQKNVKNAFVLRTGATPLIQGKRVLLIDDVFTTGATLNECSRILLNGGAASVDILTLAHTVIE